jgi:GT2 family glycosyltransferase
MIKPVLSIIIVSYNTCQITIDCIKSILADKGLFFELNNIDQSERVPAEIIIIDNNSTDNTLKEISKYHFIKIISNNSNLGFGKANNQGINTAHGNYFLLLNSDTIILHSAISQALNWLSSHPEASSCTAQLLNSDQTIQASGGFFPNLLNVFTWSTGLDDLPLINKIIFPLHPHTPEFYTHDDFYLKDHAQDWITGAFMLIRKSAIFQNPGFDEKYFMYGEELEWLYRIKKSQPTMQVWYLVGPQIIHLGGASATNRADPVINEYLGILSFFKKHKGNIQYQLAKSLLKINTALRSILYSIIGEKTKSSIYTQACSKI